MDKASAVKRLRALLGKTFAYREDLRAPRGDAERLSAKAALPAATERAKAASAARDARYRELLEGDAEYVRLRAEAKAAAAERDDLSSRSRWYRLTVGTLNVGLFVVAEGDNWADVVRAVEAKKKGAA